MMAAVIAPLDPHALPADMEIQPSCLLRWAGEVLRESLFNSA
jgi:hypothetical protein